MKKTLVLLCLLFAGIFFNIKQAKAEVIFEQPAVGGYWYDDIYGSAYFCDYAGDCYKITSSNISPGILTNFLGSNAFSAPDGKVIKSVKLSLAKFADVNDPGRLIMWCDAPAGGSMNYSSQSLKASDLETENFKYFAFDFPTSPCTLVRGFYFEIMGGWYNLKVEATQINSKVNYGIGHIQWAGGPDGFGQLTGYENIEPYIQVSDGVFIPPTPPCDLGYSSNYPGIPLPTYDYDPADGLVRFHFKTNGSQFTYRRFNGVCELQYPVLWSQKGDLFNYTPASNNIMYKAKEVKDDSGNFLNYTWQAFNEDTGQELPINLNPASLAFGDPVISIGYFSYTGYPGYSTYVEYSIFSPAVWVKDPNFVAPAVKTPVLIIPGILGSELYNGNELMWADLSRMFSDVNDNFMRDNLILDGQGNSINQIKVGNLIKKINLISPVPDLHFFDFLEEDLIKNNYSEQKDLFYFPYDWRLDLSQTKGLLKDKIEAIKSQTGSAKVDIIAHSMGGLLVKSYLQSEGKGSVNKLIFVGTPHLGAPKAADILLEGDRFGIPWLDNETMKFLAQNSPAVHELLPSPTYFSLYQGYIKPYKFFAEAPFWDYNKTKEFISSKAPSQTFAYAENFYEQNLQDMDFSGIKVYNIAGCKTGTEAGYQLTVGNNIIGQIGYISGDGTVPLPSADYINIPLENKFYVKNANHSELPSTEGVRQLIAGILNGPIISFPNVKNNKDFCNFKGKTMVWKSPVEVHVYDNDGRHTGPIDNNAIEYGIPGVGYRIIGHEKFIYLPTDDGQNYNIQAKGLDQGTFDLQIGNVNNGLIVGSTVFNDVSIVSGTPISLSVSEISTDQQIKINNQIKNSDAQLSGQQAEDLEPPQTLGFINGLPALPGWFATTTQVALIATDTLSGVLETKYSVDKGDWKIYTIPITVSEEGMHLIKFYSVDKAGNNENVQTLEIKIDKISPEMGVQFNLNTKDFEVIATDNIDLAPVKICSSTKCSITDMAGNKTIVDFQKLTLPLNIKNFVFKSINYNGKLKKFDPNVFAVGYVTSGGKLVSLSQTELIKNQQIINVVYNNKKDQSIVTDLTKGVKPIINTMKGIKFLQINTNMGIIKPIIK